MPWECSIGKAWASKPKIYEKDGRYDVSWYDQAGKRHVSTRLTLAAAESFQAQKIAELQRHREIRFDLDDREMLSTDTRRLYPETSKGRLRTKKVLAGGHVQVAEQAL